MEALAEISLCFVVFPLLGRNELPKRVPEPRAFSGP
jgi:hypothetical protein